VPTKAFTVIVGAIQRDTNVSRVTTLDKNVGHHPSTIPGAYDFEEFKLTAVAADC
jgi:hypothetical protein